MSQEKPKPPNPTTLPIDSLRGDVVAAIAAGPVVISAPTGSGKSTRVPTWCPQPVLVVEPRRVACRSLATRVASLEGTPLGDGVGYVVRDDVRARPDTPIRFVTPGIALRWAARPGGLDAATVVLDEFHERGLELDLLLGLLKARYRGHLVIMSATLEAERIATFIGGVHLQGHGRPFEVDIRHEADSPTQSPTGEGLEARVLRALRTPRDGTTLVFLPGKAEIARLQARLTSMSSGTEVLALHGGLSLGDQSRAFTTPRGPRVVLSTNVAETSLTLPNVVRVLDAGLVRRTRYHRGHGCLTLLPVAMDAAQQRAGRAGRTQRGECVRLWGQAARLKPTTPPAILRESLVPLVLGAAACGVPLDELQFIDPPPTHAIETAIEQLVGLGACEASGAITATGRQLFGWPLDPALGRWLVEAQRRGSLADVVDLVAALSADRGLFARDRPEYVEDDLRAVGCDATALVTALRRGDVRVNRLDPRSLSEAKSARKRLWKLFDGAAPAADAPVDRSALVATILAADPQAAHVGRRRKGRVAWANGGTEVTLGRDSAVDPEKTEAIVALGLRAFGRDLRRVDLRVSAAIPVKLRELARLGLGEPRTQQPRIERGRLVASVERVHAGVVLSLTDERLSGELARIALAKLFASGRWWRKVSERARDRLAAWRLWSGVRSHPRVARFDDDPRRAVLATVELEAWALEELTALGFESSADLKLLSEDDLLPPELPGGVAEVLAREFPTTLKFGDASYVLDYPSQRRVVIRQVAGKRKAPPDLGWLPSLPGFEVRFEKKGGAVMVLRARR